MATINQTYFFEDVDPDEIYELYLSSSKQAAFTASECEISVEIGGTSKMYDGYIKATNLELNPGKLIIQSWIAEEDTWPNGHLSTIRIELESQDGGTQLTFTHIDVPDSLEESLAKGWYEYYWEPMESYFG